MRNGFAHLRRQKRVRCRVPLVAAVPVLLGQIIRANRAVDAVTVGTVVRDLEAEIARQLPLHGHSPSLLPPVLAVQILIREPGSENCVGAQRGTDWCVEPAAICTHREGIALARVEVEQKRAPRSELFPVVVVTPYPVW